MWVTNATIADVFVVWAKDDSGKMCAFLVEAGAPGLETRLITNKLSLRASLTGAVSLKNVKVSKSQRMPGVEGYSSVNSCVNQAKFEIAWGVMGAAEECFHVARQYALDRLVFKKPLATYQLP
jgi:glutaryl-CoA dehydrogenase